MLEEGTVDVLVGSHIYGASGAEEGYSPTSGIEHGRLSDVLFLGVERCDVT